MYDLHFDGKVYFVEGEYVLATGYVSHQKKEF